MNYIYEVEAKSRADAEKLIADELQINIGDVVLETVQSSKGILGLVSRKPAVVRVSQGEKQLSIETLIRAVLLTIVQRMGMEIKVLGVREEDGNHLIEIESEDSGILIGRQGRTLDALQFLLNVLVDSKVRNGKRIMIDIADYREKREKRLSRLAKAVADRVAKSKQSVLLDYMNPYERRVVHLTLETDERVYTQSDGNGVYKRVRIIPANKAKENVEGGTVNLDEVQPKDNQSSRSNQRGRDNQRGGGQRRNNNNNNNRNRDRQPKPNYDEVQPMDNGGNFHSNIPD